MSLQSHIEHIWRKSSRFFRMVPQVIAYAPGRINLIGDHTDYSGGLAIPAPVNRFVLVAAKVRAARTNGHLRVHAENYDATLEWDDRQAVPTGGWEAFVVGAYSLWREHFDRDTGLELYLVGEIPQGAGLSSSAALEVAVLKAILAATGTELDDMALCKMAQQVEHRFLGVETGLLDQMAVVFGQRDHLLVIDFQSLTTAHQAMPPMDTRWVVVDSGVRRSLAHSGYQERVEEMRAGLAIVQKHFPQVEHYRDLHKHHLAQVPRPWRGRLRHFIRENLRVTAFAGAMEQGDAERAGQLLSEGHASLRDDYESSCPECDHLQSHAVEIGGCYGSRIMGGGFGGCTLNLVARERVDYFQAALLPRYGGDWGRPAQAFVFDFAPGAGLAGFG